MTTADYLTQLVNDVETVRNNLNAQGVITEPTETLTTLAPKISNIGDDLSTVVYMKLYDLPDALSGKTFIFSFNYTEYEVAKVDALLNILGGEQNG